MDGLLGPRKGFFLYTPMMLFSILGLISLWYRNTYRSLSVILLIYCFVVFSWWCWWYGGYSARVLIETYPFLLMGFCAFAGRLLGSKWPVRMFVSVLLMLCAWLNLRFSDLYNKGIIHWDSMTWGNYKAILWSNKLPDQYFEMWKKPDYEKAKREGEDVSLRLK